MRKLSAPKAPSFASLVQLFFTEYLVTQRAVSPRTVACYRDGLMLFLAFAQQRLGRTPTTLRLADIDPDLILAFLDHLEHERRNSVRSRNLRLTALRAFLKFAARRDVLSLHVVERALSVPMKRFERPMLGFLSREEMLAVLGQPGQSWTSQRDHLLLAMLYNTGARVSEIICVRVADVVLDGAACVHLQGKGRVCFIKHTRPYELSTYMFSWIQACLEKVIFVEKLRNIFFCVAHAQMDFRKLIRPASLRQRFVCAM
jgi:site-specific recombinase XerD